MNNTRNAVIGAVVLVLAAAGAGFHYWYTNTGESEDQGQVAGETNDDFVADGVPVTKDIKLGETMSIAGVSINPTDVVEESRCPQGVQCIQAGTVRVRAMVTGREAGAVAEPIIFELDVPMTLGDDQITLVRATPEPKEGTQIAPGDYTFTFTVVNGAGDEYYKG